MNFTIKCNECGCTEVDIDIYDEKLILTCGGCGNEQIIVVISED